MAMASLKQVFGAVLGGSSTLIASAAVAQQPVDKGLSFQPSVTSLMDDIVWFHDILLMPIITLTTVFVLALLLYVMWRFSEKRNPNPSSTTHNALIEVLWTGLPILILVVIAHIGLQLLTDLQGFIDPAGGDHLLTIKNAAIFNHYPKAQGISQCAIHAAGNR